MQHQNKSNENYFKLEKRRRISLKGTAKLISSLAFIFQAGRILLATLTITIISGRDSSTRNRELYLTVSRNSIVYLKRCFACVKVREKSQLSDSCSFTNLLYKSLFASVMRELFWKDNISFGKEAIGKKHLFFENLNHLLTKCWIHLNLNVTTVT